MADSRRSRDLIAQVTAAYETAHPGWTALRLVANAVAAAAFGLLMSGCATRELWRPDNPAGTEPVALTSVASTEHLRLEGNVLQVDFQPDPSSLSADQRAGMPRGLGTQRPVAFKFLLKEYGRDVGAWIVRASQALPEFSDLSARVVLNDGVVVYGRAGLTASVEFESGKLMDALRSTWTVDLQVSDDQRKPLQSTTAFWASRVISRFARSDESRIPWYEDPQKAVYPIGWTEGADPSLHTGPGIDERIADAVEHRDLDLLPDVSVVFIAAWYDGPDQPPSAHPVYCSWKIPLRDVVVLGRLGLMEGLWFDCAGPDATPEPGAAVGSIPVIPSITITSYAQAPRYHVLPTVGRVLATPPAVVLDGAIVVVMAVPVLIYCSIFGYRTGHD